MRFNILNGNVRVQHECTVDYIFKTCCAIHNQLLRLDRLDDWSQGIPNTLEDSSITDDDDDDDMISRLHPVLQRFYRNSALNANHLYPDEMKNQYLKSTINFEAV